MAKMKCSNVVGKEIPSMQKCLNLIPQLSSMELVDLVEAIEKERREKIVSLTEGFNYTQLHRITELVFIAIKDKTLEKNVYVLEDTLQAFEAMEYIFLEPAELEEIVERIRDEKTMEAAAPAVIAAAPVMYNGAMPAAGAVSAGNPSAMTDPDGSAQDYLQSRNKKKQVSLAEMYKTITSELG